MRIQAFNLTNITIEYKNSSGSNYVLVPGIPVRYYKKKIFDFYKLPIGYLF